MTHGRLLLKMILCLKHGSIPGTFRSKCTYYAIFLQWAGLAELRTAEARQVACDELFTNEEEEYSLYEAVKFLMLNRAIELYDDKEKGKEVPFFSVLLFARDTSSDPVQLLRNHLNQVGHTGGLEQVSCTFGSVLAPNSSFNHQTLCHSFCGSRIQEQLGWVVLARGLRGLQSSEGSTEAGGSTSNMAGGLSGSLSWGP